MLYAIVTMHGGVIAAIAGGAAIIYGAGPGPFPLVIAGAAGLLIATFLLTATLIGIQKAVRAEQQRERAARRRQTRIRRRARRNSIP